MSKDEKEIHRLKDQLRSEGGGPIAEYSNQAAAWLLAEVQNLVQSVRGFTEERPFISLLLAFQLGIAVGRWGARRAKY
jgi:hypothetical protein